MRNWVYRLLINRATDACYRNSLAHFSPGSRILDVGIGNGMMIKSYHPLIRAKELRITGVDVDARYLRHCHKLICQHGLREHVDVYHGSVEDYEPETEGCFDFVLFSMSFMLLEDQRSVLRRVREWLKPGGEVVFVQAMFKGKSRLADAIKPRLKYLTTIDFGRATYEEDFFALLRETGLTVGEDRLLAKEPFHSECRMIVAFWPAAVPAEALAARP